MARRRKMRCQPRVPGGRSALPSCVLREIEVEVEKRAVKFGVSKSWVVAVALAHVFGIKEQKSY